MQTQEIAEQIIEVASRYINLYEVKSNADWRFTNDRSKGITESHELLEMMEKTGWKPGLPYCAGFTKAIWKKAYNDIDASDSVLDLINKKLTPSVMVSYSNCKGMITKDPIPGSIFFMQNGSSATGHAGIVVRCDGSTITTIEGNTSPGKAVNVAQDRNGDGIYKKTRNLVFAKTSGLHLLGFLNPIQLKD